MPQVHGLGPFEVIETKDGRAVLHCLVTDDVFGPVFTSMDEAAGFCKWLREHPERDRRRQGGLAGDDPRHFTPAELSDIVASFRRVQELRKK